MESRPAALNKPRPRKKAAWSEKLAKKEKKTERKEKRKAGKDKLKREREEERLRDLDGLGKTEMDDWKELMRERKRVRSEKSAGKKTAAKTEMPVFDL